MRSAVADILPSKVRRSLVKFGADLAIARRKRKLTIAMMTERVGVSKATEGRTKRSMLTNGQQSCALCDMNASTTIE